MSIIEKFYEIFPDNVVFKILSFRPHENAILIKKDIEEIGYKYANLYSTLFEYNRLLHRGRRKAIQRRDDIDKKIKLALNEKRELVSKFLKQQMRCDETCVCRKLLSSNLDICEKETGDCFHYKEIKNIENNMRKWDVIIKEYEIERISINKNVDSFLNLKIEDVYDLSHIV